MTAIHPTGAGPSCRRQAVAGQTLIETLVAIFMLVMGISAAVGLAIYVLNSSTNISKQIIAIGLAREGAEAVKNMRDTNWLKSTLSDPTTNPPGCYDYATTANNAECYKTWLKPPGAPAAGYGYDITDPGVGKALRLNIDISGSVDLWDTKASNNKWGLNFDPDLTCASFCGFYGIPNISSGLTNGSSEYYRQIMLTEDTTPPFDQADFHRLQVEVRVWWVDSKCPRVSDWAQTISRCRVALDTNLTNWKDY